MQNHNIHQIYEPKVYELLMCLYQKDITHFLSLSEQNAAWIYNDCFFKNNCHQFIETMHMFLGFNTQWEIKNLLYRSLPIPSEFMMITGTYELWVTNAQNIVQKYTFSLLLLYHNQKVLLIKISEIVTPYNIHAISTRKDSLFFRDEREILYLETQHNCVIWHCLHENLTERTTLSYIENNLSGNFIKIHRCYIVNALHIKLLRNYEVEMSNGDILPIPRRQFHSIKTQIKKYCHNMKC